MKKIIVFFISIGSVFQSFGQQTDSIPHLTKADYLLKSKKQRNTGFILLTGGLLTTAIGALSSLGEGLGNLLVAEEDRSNSGGGIAVAGIIIMGSSIPFFIASSSSKKKAITLSVKNEKALILNKNAFSYTSIPSLNLKIRL